ncbi:hypothetical protein MP638_006423 [Amoeboaphelidium occidentale]|nr:hypothetical protein MP638_006423 [Amoeboaphelidium occidentale]
MESLELPEPLASRTSGEDLLEQLLLRVGSKFPFFRKIIYAEWNDFSGCKIVAKWKTSEAQLQHNEGTIIYAEWNDFSGCKIVAKWKTSEAQMQHNEGTVKLTGALEAQMIRQTLTPDIRFSYECDEEDTENDLSRELKWRIHRSKELHCLSVIFKSIRVVSYSSGEHLMTSAGSMTSRPSVLSFMILTQDIVDWLKESGLDLNIYATDYDFVTELIIQTLKLNVSCLIAEWKAIQRGNFCTSISAQQSSLDPAIMSKLENSLAAWTRCLFNDSFRYFVEQRIRAPLDRLEDEVSLFSKKYENIYGLEFFAKCLSSSLSTRRTVVVGSDRRMINLFLDTLKLFHPNTAVTISTSTDSISKHHLVQGLIVPQYGLEGISITDALVLELPETSTWIDLDALTVKQTISIQQQYNNMRNQFYYDRIKQKGSKVLLLLKDVDSYSSLVTNFVRTIFSIPYNMRKDLIKEWLKILEMKAELLSCMAESCYSEDLSGNTNPTAMSPGSVDFVSSSASSSPINSYVKITINGMQ